MILTVNVPYEARLQDVFCLVRISYDSYDSLWVS